MNTGKGRTVVTKTGAAASAHLQELRARKPQAFSEAIRRLRARGWTPTEHVAVLVELRERPAAPRNGATATPGNVRGEEDSISDESGELVFWSWDNGEGTTTWQGAVYFDNYITGETQTSDTQVDTSVPEFPVSYEHITYYREPKTQERDIASQADVGTLARCGPRRYAVVPVMSRRVLRVGRVWLYRHDVGLAGVLYRRLLGHVPQRVCARRNLRVLVSVRVLWTTARLAPV